MPLPVQCGESESSLHSPPIVNRVTSAPSSSTSISSRVLMARMREFVKFRPSRIFTRYSPSSGK